MSHPPIELAPGRHPWERQPGESPRFYQRFCRYRDLGPDRTVRRAVDVARYPKKARHGIWLNWKEIGTRFRWVLRSQAWDDQQAVISNERAMEASLRARQMEIEENERQRVLRIQEARALRTAGREVFTRFLELVRSGAVSKMVLERLKHIEVAGPPSSQVRIERETKGILEILSIAGEAIAEGQRLERLELGQPVGREAEALDPRERKKRELVERMAEAILDDPEFPADDQRDDLPEDSGNGRGDSPR